MLPDGTKPLPEPLVTYHGWDFVAFTCRRFHRKPPRYLSLIWVSKCINFILQQHLPEANEFIKGHHAESVFLPWRHMTPLEWRHNNGAMASQITGVSIAYSTVCSGAHHRKHQASTSLAFERGIHRSPVNSPHKGPATRKIFPFDDVIMPTYLMTRQSVKMVTVWISANPWDQMVLPPLMQLSIRARLTKEIPRDFKFH